MIETILSSVLSFFYGVQSFLKIKNEKDYKSPFFIIKPSFDYGHENFIILEIKIRSECVSPVSHVVLSVDNMGSKDIGKLNPGEEKSVEYIVENSFDEYNTQIYISCLTEFGETKLKPMHLLDHRLFIKETK